MSCIHWLLFTFQVEGLLDDIDLKILVTREQLEELCKDLFDRIRSPVEQALKTSGLSIDVISQVKYLPYTLFLDLQFF